jgi:hypothetical protein
VIIPPPAKKRSEATRVLPPKILTQESGKDIPLIPLDDIVLRIITLAQTICERKFYPYQVQFSYRLIESLLLRDGETVSALLARQSGKTEGLAGTICALLIILPVLAKKYPTDWRLNMTDESGRYRGFAQGIKIGIYAPKLEQAEVMFNRVRSFLETKNAQRVLSELNITLASFNGNTVTLSSGARVICQTASDNAKIEGETHHLLVLEEAQDMSDMKIKKSLRPMVASTRGTICMIGTATTQRCVFYDMIKHNERVELSGGRRNHFFYPHQVCSQYNSLYRDYIEQEKIRLGEMSDEFRMSYGGEWIFERGMFASNALLFRKQVAIDAPELFSQLWTPEDARLLTPNLSFVAGIDWGRDHDSTIVTIGAVDWLNPVQSLRASNEFGEFNVDLYRKYVVDWKEWHGDNYESQFHEITAYLRRWGGRLKKVVTDSNTCGQPIFDRLVASFAMEDVEIVPFNFSAKMKSDGYKAFYAELCGQRFSFPAGPKVRSTTEYRKFINQMLDLRKSYRNGLMVVDHPDTKSAHDDYCDSAMLMCWGTLTAPADTEIDFSDGNMFMR